VIKITKKIGDTLIIEEEPPDLCEFCKEYKELRPYGPNGENICHSCAMKDEESAKAQFFKLMEGH
jgi:hypothetical protein